MKTIEIELPQSVFYAIVQDHKRFLTLARSTGATVGCELEIFNKDGAGACKRRITHVEESTVLTVSVAPL